MDRFRKDRELSCPDCGNSYNYFRKDEDLMPKNPLLLNCGHSSCYGCIKAKAHKAKGVKCSSCAVVSQINKLKINEEFPLSTFIVGKIMVKKPDGPKESCIGFYRPHKQMDSQDKVPCCECEKAAADCACHQCNVQFCSSCFDKVHSVGVALRRHKKIAIDVADNIFCEEALCQEHLGSLYEFFCEDCSKYICDICLRNEHLKHACVAVNEKNKEMYEECVAACKKADSILKQLRSTQKELSNTRVSDLDANNTEKEITKHFTQLHGLLQLQEQHLLNEIRNCQESSRGSHSLATDTVTAGIMELEKLLPWCRNALEESSFPLFGIITKLNKAMAVPCQLAPNEAPETSKYALEIDSNIINQIKEHCKLTIPTKRTFKLCPMPQENDLDNVVQNEITPQLQELEINDKKENLQEKSSISAITAALQNLPQTEVKTKIKKTSFQELLLKNRLALQKNAATTLSADSVVGRISAIAPLTTGTTEIVTLCHLVNPNNFYVQRKCSQLLLDQLTEEFSKYATAKARPPDEIVPETMYLCLYNKNWYRGVVKKLHTNSTYDVFYVDYGNTETVHINEMREIPLHHTKFPGQAVHCSLQDCVSVTSAWTVETITLLAKMTDDKEFTMYIDSIDSGLHKIHLRSTDDTILSVAEVLIYLGHAQLAEKSAIEDVPFKKLFFDSKKTVKGYFKDIYVKEKETFNAQITHVYSPTNFYIQKLSDGGKQILQLMKELHKTYGPLKADEGLVFSPIPGLPVAAKFSDGQWYRAVVLQIVDTCQVQIQYVDFGNIESVKWEDIRILDPKFLRINILGIKCALSDIAPIHPKGWTVSAKKGFEDMACKDTLFRVFVDKVEQGQVDVVVYDLQQKKGICFNGQMVKNGHAKCVGPSATTAEYLRESADDLSDSDCQPLCTSSASQACQKKNIPGKTKLQKSESKGRSTSKTDSLSSECKSEVTALVIEGGSDEASKLKVKILKVVNPGEIYVTFSETHKQILNLVAEMTQHYKSIGEADRSWEAGDLCAVLRLNDKKWYRGVIKSVAAERYKVFIKDIVDIVEVDSSGLRSLDNEFLRIGDGSIKCHLSGIIPTAGGKTWPQMAVEHLKIFLNDSHAEYFFKNTGELVNDSIPVQLWKKNFVTGGAFDPTEEVWKDVSRELISVGLVLPENKSPLFKNIKNNYDFTKSITPSSSVAEWLHESFEEAVQTGFVCDLEETIAIEKASNTSKATHNKGPFVNIADWTPAKPFQKLDFIATATYVDHDCAIYLQELECESTLEVIRNGLSSVFSGTAAQPHDLEWSKGQICTARYIIDGNWYRGKVKKVTPEHIEVYFVDYGNTEFVQPEDLRKEIVLGHIPIQCHRCTIEGLIPVSRDGKWPLKALDFIHGMVVTQKCRVILQKSKANTDEYTIKSLTIPCGEDLMELLLSLHYATYVIDCDTVGNGVEDDEIILETDPTDILPDVNLRPKILADNLSEISEAAPIVPETTYTPVYDWFDLTGVCEQGSGDILQTYKDLIIPDSIVELTVEVCALSSSTSVKVMITACDDPEVMSVIDDCGDIFKEIQEQAENMLFISEPIKGMPCVGCFTEDDVWYRAVITDIDEALSLCDVYYVDYGNSEQIPIDRLRTTKPEWLRTPKLCIDAKLFNVCEGPKYDGARLENLLLNCFRNPPYTMVINARQPCLEVELFNSSGVLTYQNVINLGLLANIDE